MEATGVRAEAMVSQVATTMKDNSLSGLSAFDRHDSPIYATDSDGWVIYFNRACIGFAGRTPVKGGDRWCVTWKLYDLDGRFLPHDQCPMAIAIRQGRPVRNVEAWVERPDGSRVHMLPFPTPILDDGGAVTGAVNLLVDLSRDEEMKKLGVQAARCRRLARDMDDPTTVTTLTQLAKDYEARALELSGLK